MNRLSDRTTRTWLTAAVTAGILLLIAGCTSGSTVPESDDGTQQEFKVCMATGGAGLDWMDGQGDVARAMAKLRGWDYAELSNDNDGPTATKNAEVFIQDKCNAVLEFNGQPSVNPVLAAKFAAAKIPVITFDIGQEGWYFLGIDNAKAGNAGGAALGKIAKAKWDCEPDLVLSSEAAAAGIVNDQRTGGMREGVKSVCPDIPESKFVSFEGNGLLSDAQPAARAVLASHPAAKKILVVGINDSGVVGALQAAQQLGRTADIIAWGQDGSLVTGPNVNPNLAGSVFYFLEGYPVYAFTEILDKIAAGTPPEVGDNTNNNPTVLLAPCPVTQAQAAAIPSMADRITKLLAAPEGETEDSLFCPVD